MLLRAGCRWVVRVGGYMCWASCANCGGLPSSDSADSCAPRLSRTGLEPRDVEELTFATSHWDVAVAAFRPTRPSGRGGELPQAYVGHGHCTLEQSVPLSTAEARKLVVVPAVGAHVCAWRIGRHMAEKPIHVRTGPEGKPRNMRHVLDKCWSTMRHLVPRGLLRSRFANN